MKKFYVIESVMHPGSFWAEDYDKFKGWLYATKYTPWENDSGLPLSEASKKEPCKITEVYDK